MTEPAPEWWFKAIADFGANLGFADAGGWREEVLNLSMDGGKYLLDVERSGETIVIALLSTVSSAEFDKRARFIMRQCSFEHYRPFFLQVGLKGESTLVLAARLHFSEAHKMYGALEQIRKVFAEAAV